MWKQQLLSMKYSNLLVNTQNWQLKIKKYTYELVWQGKKLDRSKITVWGM